MIAASFVRAVSLELEGDLRKMDPVRLVIVEMGRDCQFYSVAGTRWFRLKRPCIHALVIALPVHQ